VESAGGGTFSTAPTSPINPGRFERPVRENNNNNSAQKTDISLYFGRFYLDISPEV
jgi:hypothetical protein